MEDSLFIVYIWKTVELQLLETIGAEPISNNRYFLIVRGYVILSIY